MFAVAFISWVSSKRNTLGDNVICVSVLGLFSSHFSTFGECQDESYCGRTYTMLGRLEALWKVFPTGHMKEGAVVFERENRNAQETRLYFFLLHREQLITVLS